MPDKPQPFTVMVKPVGSHCNLRCSYCYYLETERPTAPLQQARMTDELLELFIRQYIEASQGPEVSFVWHGGEPSLAGLDFYRRAVQLQQKYLPEAWVCWNNLQTNGVLLDEQWCSFLADAHFDVGLSIDGTREQHDRYRRDARGEGSYASVIESAQRLEAHGIRPDLLCTVTSSTAKDALAAYRALRELNSGWMQFIPIVRQEAAVSQAITNLNGNSQFSAASVTPDSIGSAEYREFLCTVFDEWVLHDLGRLEVQMFAETARVWAGGSAGLCWMAETCGRALIVEVDGGVYSCDHFVTPEHRIGDLATTHLAELAELPAQQFFGERKQSSLPGQCRRCEWLKFCNGGCPKDRFLLSEDGEPGLNYLCAGFKRFFSYARPLLDELTRLRKQGINASTIMANLQELKRSQWQGVGRNDPCPCGSGFKAKNCCWLRRA